MIANIMLALVFVAAVTDWIAVYKGWQKVEYVAKPATLALLFVWLVLKSHLAGALLWFGLGALFSLAGDVFLMFSERWFIPGLLAFLLAHGMYIIGFNLPLPDVAPLWALGVAIILALSAARVLRYILAGLVAKGQRKLIGPVVVYGVVITLMLLSALLTLFRPDWPEATAALLVSVGAFLFFLSDVILAWNKFVNPIQNGRIMNMVTYHLGQVALIAGVVVRFVK